MYIGAGNDIIGQSDNNNVHIHHIYIYMYTTGKYHTIIRAIRAMFHTRYQELTLVSQELYRDAAPSYY